MKRTSLLLMLILLSILLLALAGCVRYENGEPVDASSDESEEQTEEAFDGDDPDEEGQPEEKTKPQEEVETEKIIEFDEQLQFAEFTVENIKAEIEGDELKLKFDWINQSGKEDVPFSALGYFDVMQGDEILKETSGAFDPTSNSDVLRRAANGVTLPVTLIYGIANDESVVVKFGATHELDDAKEEITIEIN